ncbi:cob(I)yrinic acid a,c-diamide adenosyltransferase [Paenalcaligenes niemegkensis]|uniref:cob(I)yrinic acid a,c-diamide adenosyltransferase n=1 Tax=Paenalcaligenes niemegkensis TaxID=2895469 RepID=UPI001EE8C55A|nr:cob(I)yrinic acid a,c-diamide adenosyltransferase [Paenalcaligenes niemegkensis]MCQ9617492.1 cob(I)yrinic acid a,c-diamide adenosyltransferase [Paenalcaligenes niemegkensis]
MATRLSVITTRTGDGGQTGLGDGTRIAKHSLRIHALGDVDELNSVIGLWRCESLPADIDEVLSSVQHDLFDMGAELCIPGHIAMKESHVLALEEALKHYNADLGKLEEFILPGGTKAASMAHMARTVSRRAERAVVALMQEETIEPPIQQYLNRLSDLCFVLARALNRSAGQGDVLWKRK